MGCVRRCVTPWWWWPATEAMAITAAAVTATQEVPLPGRGDAMTLCDGDEVWVYTADNAGAGTTAEQPACTWAALWGK